MNLSTLLADFYPDKLPREISITDLSLDSRQVKSGTLFFARRGTQLDGRAFIEDAIQNGASAILMEGDFSESHWETAVPIIAIPDLSNKLSEIAARFYAYPTHEMQIIGVTGTSGKTSCTQFMGFVFQELQIPCGIIGTLGNGLYGAIKAGMLTTPDNITLQRTFAEFLQQGAHIAAMEVSSHSLDQGRVSGIEFAVGVFTNLTRDHLDYHGTMEAYGAAKKRLFLQSKIAVINADDLFGQQLLVSLEPTQRILTYGVDAKADVSAKNVLLTSSGIKATIHTPWGEAELHSTLVGQFNLSNLLAVITTLCALDIPLEKVIPYINQISPVPGRMQALGGHTKPLVIVDYAHKPDALEKVLIALRQQCAGKLYCVFGCGGERDRGKRPIMAKIAEQYADQIIVTDDNPRHEDPGEIIREIMQGFIKTDNVIIQHDRSKAIHNVIQCAVAGDCVLIAGKGAETYQQIGDQKILFSDAEKVKNSLERYKC
jgi:UDP-N-acetylmuramoyl-L-alanyl-D-glutamate--2,6-diaminopimelate ligase